MKVDYTNIDGTLLYSSLSSNVPSYESIVNIQNIVYDIVDIEYIFSNAEYEKVIVYLEEAVVE